MKNYDDFISELKSVPDIPQNIYGKVRFRVGVEKMAFNAVAVFLFLIAFVGISTIFPKAENEPLEWTCGTEEIIFTQNNFCALFD